MLVAKVKVILKRYAKGSSEKYDDGNLVLDYINKKVLVKDKEVKFTALEFKLLTYLIDNKGKLVSKQELFGNVWNDKFTQDGTLNVHIKKIREQIEEKIFNFTYYFNICC